MYVFFNRTNIFCDKYDSSQQTYCKRLRVLCPEHTKEPKVIQFEPCIKLSMCTVVETRFVDGIYIISLPFSPPPLLSASQIGPKDIQFIACAKLS